MGDWDVLSCVCVCRCGYNNTASDKICFNRLALALALCINEKCLRIGGERTTQREQNMKRKVIMGPDHLLVRAFRQQW